MRNSSLPILKPGDGIGLIAPAGFVQKDQIQPAVSILESNGFRLKMGEHLFGSHRFFSGTIQERLADIHAFLKDPRIQGLYAVRGGVGSAQLLPYLDFNLWKTSGKLLIGFSDLTALQWALWYRTGVPSWSGMTLTSQLHPTNPFLKMFFNFLLGRQNHISVEELPNQELSVARTGRAEGILIGGTLSIINSLLGTPFFPGLDSIILYLEDENEPLYRLERFLIQLNLAGVTERITGLILGRFRNANQPIDIWPEVAYLFSENIPVILNFPYGHFPHICPLPIGVHAFLEADPFSLIWQ